MFLVICSEVAYRQIHDLLDVHAERIDELKTANRSLYSHLMNDPLDWGESREGNRRIGFEYPVNATVSVDTTKNRVDILSVKWIARPPSPEIDSNR